MALADPRSHDMVIFGGDPLLPDKEFLNDLWRLKGPSEFGEPTWQSIQPSNGSNEGQWISLQISCLAFYSKIIQLQSHAGAYRKVS